MNDASSTTLRSAAAILGKGSTVAALDADAPPALPTLPASSMSPTDTPLSCRRIRVVLVLRRAPLSITFNSDRADS